MKTETADQAHEWEKLKTSVGIGLPSSDEEPEGKNIVRFMDKFSESYEGQKSDVFSGDLMFVPRGAFDSAYNVSDIQFLSLDEIGQALVLLSSLWSYGDELVSNFTPIEYKMYVEALSAMIAVQQLEAQDLTEPKKNLA